MRDETVGNVGPFQSRVRDLRREPRGLRGHEYDVAQLLPPQTGAFFIQSCPIASADLSLSIDCMNKNYTENKTGFKAKQVEKRWEKAGRVLGRALLSKSQEQHGGRAAPPCTR